WLDGPATEDRSNLTAGTYTLSISDNNGCEQEEIFTLTDPPGLSVTLDEVIDVSCNQGSDGQVLTTVSGGSEPYTFQWNDPNVGNSEDAGSLTAGTYTLVVTDDRGCTATLTETVSEPPALTLDFRDYSVSCRNGNDGAAVVIATGGNGGYTYNWQTNASQDSISNLTSGTYGVTVTDQRGCIVTGSVTVNQPANALTAAAVQDEMGCFGAAMNVATVSASGGTTPYTYAWSSGEVTATANTLPAGMATVVVTDANDCTETVTLTIDEHPAITASILATSPSCNDRTDGRLGAVPSGGTGMTDADYTFQWSNNESGIVITNLPGDVLYRVTITDPIGCTGEAERFLPAPAPITFTVQEDPVDCFGNSTGGLTIVNISGPNPGDFDLQWSSEAGFAMTPSISGLPAGTNYGLEIIDEDGCTADTVLTISEPTVLQADITKIDVGCFGDSDGRLSASGTGGIGSYQYAWSNASNQNQITGLSAGSYDLTLTDANGCEEITTNVITEPEPITISASADPALCEGEATGTITVTGGGGRPPFVYGIENRGFTRNNVFVGLPAEEYVTFVRDSAGCQISTNVIVNDGPPFSLDLGPDSTIIFGDSIEVQPMVIGGVDTVMYFWKGSYDGTLSCTDCPTPLARPEYEIDYFLTVMDGNGCAAEDRFRVSVRKTGFDMRRLWSRYATIARRESLFYWPKCGF
ncbi:MAG: SprB repeat-containing protein, partial [Bacteroidota bacterium]